MYRLFATLAAAVAVVAPASAQQYQRRATMVGGGGGDRGKCTIEVIVDGAAEIDIRGDQGVIRNLSGQPAQWRRFECSSPLPSNPADFRFAGIDGRGRQTLIREPRNGSAAVVRIEDSSGGSEGYTFDLMWGGGNGPGGYPDRGPGGGYPGGGYPGVGPGGGYPGGGRRFTTQQAIGVCQDSVRHEAITRFRGRSVEFVNTRIDDNPGRNDWVIGAIDVIRGHNAPEGRYRFSCSVNFDSGQVRSVEVDPHPMGGGDWHGGPGGPNGGSSRAIQGCQAAVDSRMRRDGYTRVDFQAIRMDDKPGRDDWVIGNLRAAGPRGNDNFNFSCSVNMRDGDIRSVDVTRR